MARLGHPVHEALVDRLHLGGGETVVDLGCGRGPTLAAVAGRVTARLVGLDLQPKAIEAARTLLDGYDADLRVADLSGPLPLADATADAVVCHNVLECLADPVALVTEAARVMRPGAVAVWSHTDFDALVINSTDVQLGRQIVHAYADHTQSWMPFSDGRMGRKLAGVVRDSPLRLDDVDVHVTGSTELTGDARERVEEISTVLERGAFELAADDVRRWRDDIDATAAAGDFFFAEPCFVVTSGRE